jgi:hypothetical protein
MQAFAEVVVFDERAECITPHERGADGSVSE